MKTTKVLLLALLPLMFVLSGCETFAPGSHHRATSVMKFLYPNDYDHAESPSIPVLSLPLKVGVAFVPVEQSKAVKGALFPVTDLTVNEAQKMQLMKEVSEHFKQYPFVRHIELIPTAYLTPGGSFANLDQLRAMFGVDVIALISYDQVQFTDEGLLTLTYWTIVGAYAVPGEKNDTRTMLDTVVYDIKSRKMLFRAPGTSHIKHRSTLVGVTEQLREDSEAGFKVAATNLVTALDFQLSQFKERIKEAPEEIKVVHKPGYVGGAANGPLELLVAGAMAVAAILLRIRSRQAAA